MEQLTLFPDLGGNEKKKEKKYLGSSRNSVKFNDYESFLMKFDKKDLPKTTDDCYTPADVYEAVVRYVLGIHPLGGKDILRPFYPGGDYRNAEYPEGGVVIDNPPFSILSQIVRFYVSEGVPFFLFAPGMTALAYSRLCTAVIVDNSVRFANGARVRVNFLTNLLGDEAARTAPSLKEAINACPSQATPPSLTLNNLPHEVMTVSTLQQLSSRGVEVGIRRGECEFVKVLGKRRKNLFGGALIAPGFKDVVAKVRPYHEGGEDIELTRNELRIIEQINSRKNEL